MCSQPRSTLTAVSSECILQNLVNKQQCLFLNLMSLTQHQEQCLLCLLILLGFQARDMGTGESLGDTLTLVEISMGDKN